LITVMAIYLLLRGHDLPGGGFFAGVTMAVAFILQYMARGTAWVEDRLRVLPVRWMGAGLLLANCNRRGDMTVRPALPHLFVLLPSNSNDWRRSRCERAPVRHWRVRSGRRRDRADADRDRPSMGAESPRTARPRAWTASSIAAEVQ
jgi:hypothetical protein